METAASTGDEMGSGCNNTKISVQSNARSNAWSHADASRSMCLQVQLGARRVDAQFHIFEDRARATVGPLRAAPSRALPRCVSRGSAGTPTSRTPQAQPPRASCQACNRAAWASMRFTGLSRVTECTVGRRVGATVGRGGGGAMNCAAWRALESSGRAMGVGGEGGRGG